jgi:predicted nucleic acid-binding protein
MAQDQLVVSVPFTDLMAKYCLSLKPFVPDMLIAASCLYFNLPLYTHNAKDFKFIPGLKLHPA